MPKRKAESSATATQRKTHLGFKEMASEEEWQQIYSKTQQILISNAQDLYNSQTGEGGAATDMGPCLSPPHEVEEDTGYKQSSLLDHFKVKECPHDKDSHKQELISPSKIDKQICAYCLKCSFARLSLCFFCERTFCPSCLGKCSRCLKAFCSVCSQTDYTGPYDQLVCLSCASESC